MSSNTVRPTITPSDAPEPARLREPGRQVPEPGPGEAEAPVIRIREAIDDRWLMAALIPAFGLSIPHAASLFGPLGPADAAWWLGHAWFVGGAGLIYGANRTLLFAGRSHADWFSRPVARLAILATGVVFGTVPTTWLMLHFWSALSGVPLGDGLRLVTVINITCVLFVTWLYETLFLIQERVDDQVQVTELEAARARSELDALRAQVDPHFLFNALNTLQALIDSDPEEARRFVDHLARVYRGLLDARGRTTVTLAEELELADAYAELLRVRFGGAVVVLLPKGEVTGRIPPGAVQVLVENAVRHNAVDPDEPLVIEVGVEDDAVVVRHPHRPKRRPNPGTGTGLENLDARCRGLVGRGIDVERGADWVVRVPRVEA